jgi:hypothetical protein
MCSRAALCAFWLCSVGLTGCSLWHRKPRPPEPPRPVAVGTVTLVNEAGKFVLVDNGALPVPPVGGVLKSYAKGATEASGELVATDVRKRPFTIADIREGAPQKGDRVVYMPPELLRGPSTVSQGEAAASPQPSTGGPGAQ